jgi:hypothetical protein
LGSDHPAVFAVEIRQAHGVNFAGGSKTAGPILSPKREAGVFDQERIEAQISRHTDGGFDGIVGNHPSHDEHGLLLGTQAGFEIGADKRAVGLFDDHDLAKQGLRLWLEIVSRLARAVVRLWLGRIVTNV